jgi:hypothetical protein
MSIRKAGIGIIAALFLTVPAIAQSTIASGSTPLTTAGNNVDLKTGSGGTIRFFNSSSSQLLTITESGRLGIGETSPAVQLHVVGNAHIVGGVGKGGVYTDTTSSNDPILTLKVNNVNGNYPRLRFADENNAEMGAVWGWKNTALLISAPSNRFIGLRAGGSNLDQFVVAANGWVGVGGGPNAFFHVQGDINQYMLVQRGTKALYVNANWSGQNAYAQVAARGSDNMGLSLSSNDNAPQYLYIAPDGRVGINTLSLATNVQLNVNGNANFNGTVTGTKIQAHYQDVAEWVPSRTDLAPGTVVVLDAVLGNGVAASTTPYDTTVAGVVSAQPGLILGIEGDSKEQVATTGRVKVKVDASRGPIAVGDLLVTSDKPGYAMRSTPIEVGGVQIHRPGTIVGKALEPLREGQGEILVLLSLQ